MNNLIIIQARLSSTRLPGKILKPLIGGKCLLDLQLETLKKLDIPYVLATSTNQADDLLEDWAIQNQVECFRGEEHNVLQRFIDCAEQYNAEQLIRVCSDNPFLQFGQVSLYFKVLSENVDYISFCNAKGIPAIKTHWGLFVEGVKLSALKRASELLQDNAHRGFYSEHVTNFIYGHPKEFRVVLEEAPEVISSRNDLRFTIDTPADFENMHSLLKLVDPNTTLGELIKVVDAHPTIKSIMRQGIDQFKK
jgi:spore coat polysaccharide biosynthesis protein SpsF